MMKQIIQKAIEGGWNKEQAILKHPWLPHEERIVAGMVVCDPLFWQALGKACGWGEGDLKYHRNIFFGMIFEETEGWDKAVEYLNNLITPHP